MTKKQFRRYQDGSRTVVQTNIVSFRADMLGPFDQVEIQGWDRWDPPPHIAEEIETCWRAAQKKPHKPSPGPLWRVEEATRAHGAGVTKLLLRGAMTDYRDHLGTNLNRALELRPSERANPLGVDALIVTRDGIPFGAASRRKHEGAGQWSIMGANFQPPAWTSRITRGRGHEADGRVSKKPVDHHPFDTLTRECREEFCLDLGPRDEVTCYGLVESLTTRRPSLVYSVQRLDLDRGTFLKSIVPSTKYELHWERQERQAAEKEAGGPEFDSDSFRFVPPTTDGILGFIGEFFRDGADPNGIHEVYAGTLLLYGSLGLGLFDIEPTQDPPFEY